MAENDKLSSLGGSCVDSEEIFKVIAKVNRKTLLETVLREEVSLGSVDPQHGR